MDLIAARPKSSRVGGNIEIAYALNMLGSSTISLFVLFVSLSEAGATCLTTQDLAQQTTAIAEGIATEINPACSLPEVGEARAIDIPTLLSPTGARHAYKLRRVADKRFEVFINPKFGRAFHTSYDSAALQKKWRKKASECLRAYDGKLLGPSGESISIQIEPEQHPDTPQIWIEIDPLNQRDHSARWSEDIDCPTILHEVLHLTGLADEYPEVISGFIKDENGSVRYVQENPEKPAFDCRVIGDPESVMYNQVMATSVAKSDWRSRMEFCECKPGSEKLCESYLITHKPKSAPTPPESKPGKNKAPEPVKLPGFCPDGFETSADMTIVTHIEKAYLENVRKTGMGSFTSPKGLAGKNMEKLVVAGRLYPNQKKSLLEPQHVNVILYPGCLEKNSRYYEESLNAYRTSLENYGEGCIDLNWTKTTDAP